MSLSADIISQKKDLVVTSCKKLGAEELAALRSSPIHTVFEVYAQDDVDVSRRKLHQIQYTLQNLNHDYNYCGDGFFHLQMND